MKEQKSLEHRAWDKLKYRLDHEEEGNRSMNRNIRVYCEWAMEEVEKQLEGME